MSVFESLPIGPPLSQSGLLQLDEDYGEIQLLVLENVELRSLSETPLPIISSSSKTTRAASVSSYESRCRNLLLTLTSHRIIFVQKKKGRNTDGNETRFIHLSMVKAISQVQKSLLSSLSSSSSNKILLDMFSHYGEMHVVFKDPYNSNLAYQNCKDLYDKLVITMKRKQWEEYARLEEKRKQRDFNLTNNNATRPKVGVDAILSKNKAKHKQAQKLSEDAFSGDAETLLREAKELTDIIHKYVATLERKQKDGDNTDAEKSTDQVELSKMLTNMGMASGLSKENFSSERQYNEQLAREIADFLRAMKSRSSSHGGNNNDMNMITLTEVYCLFNRARGTNFISPDDLLNASRLLEVLKLGMSVRTFPDTGVVVIQDDSFRDEHMHKMIMEKCFHIHSENDCFSFSDYEEQKGITPLEASRCLNISNVILVTEHMYSAERKGLVCRDETLEGIRFFPNMFSSWNNETK